MRTYRSSHISIGSKDPQANLRLLILVYHFYGNKEPPLNGVDKRDIRELYRLMVPGADFEGTFLEPHPQLWALRCRIRRKFRWIESVDPSNITHETAESWFVAQVEIHGLWHCTKMGPFSNELRAEIAAFDPNWRP